MGKKTVELIAVKFRGFATFLETNKHVLEMCEGIYEALINKDYYDSCLKDIEERINKAMKMKTGTRKKSLGTIEIYKDKRGEWRWRVKACNGRILADSGEGYKTKRGLEKGLDSLFYDKYKVKETEEWIRNID